MSPDITPFNVRTAKVVAPMRTLHRFTKPGGHVAEIRERIVTKFKAFGVARVRR